MFMKAPRHGIATAVTMSGANTGKFVKRTDLLSF